MEDNNIGRLLDGRYEILEKIGAGGMAVVYKARDHRLNRLVAVKMLKLELSQDENLRRSFYAESQAIAMFSSPNIVAVYDVNQDGSSDYIVMELIEGITLKQYISRKGALSWRETLHFSTQIARGLSHAHAKGIIHRDIKPHNIMILRDGTVKVADFGIAHLMTGQRTLTQHALGSVHYMSPEQAKGEEVDARTDIYSLGIVMYEMMTNKLPFDGDTPVAIALRHISSVPPSPREENPDIPEGLEQIILHAMAANKDERYPSAEALLRDLERFRRDPEIRFSYDSDSDSEENMDRTMAVKHISAVDLPETPTRQHKQQQEQKTQPERGRSVAEIRQPVVTKEQYRENRRRTRNATLFIGIVLVLTMLIGLFLFAYDYFLKDVLDPAEERVSIPNFVGMTYTDVLANDDYGQYYNFKIANKSSDLYAPGKIMEQDVVAFTSMTVQKNGIDVTLTVSSGPEVKTMPNLINLDYRQARIELENLKLNLNINVSYQYNDEYTSGMVYEQYPLENTALVEGGTVYFTYSIGKEQKYTTVPDVMTLTEVQAIARLGSYHMAYTVTYDYDETAPAGTVIYQSLDPGTSVEYYTPVELVVSKGQDPALHPPEPEPEVEEPAEEEHGADEEGGTQTPSEEEAPPAEQETTPD